MEKKEKINEASAEDAPTPQPRPSGRGRSLPRSQQRPTIRVETTSTRTLGRAQTFPPVAPPVDRSNLQHPIQGHSEDRGPILPTPRPRGKQTDLPREEMARRRQAAFFPPDGPGNPITPSPENPNVLDQKELKPMRGTPNSTEFAWMKPGAPGSDQYSNHNPGAVSYSKGKEPASVGFDTAEAPNKPAFPYSRFSTLYDPNTVPIESDDSAEEQAAGGSHTRVEYSKHYFANEQAGPSSRPEIVSATIPQGYTEERSDSPVSPLSAPARRQYRPSGNTSQGSGGVGGSQPDHPPLNVNKPLPPPPQGIEPVPSQYSRESITDFLSRDVQSTGSLTSSVSFLGHAGGVEELSHGPVSSLNVAGGEEEPIYSPVSSLDMAGGEQELSHSPVSSLDMAGGVEEPSHDPVSPL